MSLNYTPKENTALPWLPQMSFGVAAMLWMSQKNGWRNPWSVMRIQGIFSMTSHAQNVTRIGGWLAKLRRKPFWPYSSLCLLIDTYHSRRLNPYICGIGGSKANWYGWLCRHAWHAWFLILQTIHHHLFPQHKVFILLEHGCNKQKVGTYSRETANVSTVCPVFSYARSMDIANMNIFLCYIGTQNSRETTLQYTHKSNPPFDVSYFHM